MDRHRSSTRLGTPSVGEPYSFETHYPHNRVVGSVAVTFRGARFSGSAVTFDYAEFYGGTVTSIAPGTANITAL
jgi:hypothetical protein